MPHSSCKSSSTISKNTRTFKMFNKIKQNLLRFQENSTLSKHCISSSKHISSLWQKAQKLYNRAILMISRKRRHTFFTHPTWWYSQVQRSCQYEIKKPDRFAIPPMLYLEIWVAEGNKKRIQTFTATKSLIDRYHAFAKKHFVEEYVTVDSSCTPALASFSFS